MNRVLVAGAQGQLGRCIQMEISRFRELYGLFPSKKTLDITQLESILEIVRQKSVNTIINCAAYTQVDAAEENPEKAYAINILGVKNLVAIAEQENLKLIHCSTDYVFDGLSPTNYSEDDLTNPMGIYGKTKAKGEQSVLNSKARSLVVRTSWLFSPFGQNFVKTILRLSKEKKELNVVDDQYGRPTYAVDLAKVLLNFASQTDVFKHKIYHFANEGVATWCTFAREIVKLSRNNCIIRPVATKDFLTKAKRPKNSVLNTDRIEKTLNLVIRSWNEALRESLTYDIR